jgi:hypothetical protein
MAFKTWTIQLAWKSQDIPILAMSRAWSYQQKFSDLSNFQKKSENFKPTIFCQKGQKNYLADVLAWID